MSAASFPPSQNSTFGRFGSSCCWTACCSIHSRLGFSRGACGVSANNKLQVANFSQFQLARHCCGSQLHRFFFFLVRFFCTGSFCNFRKCLCLYLEKSCLLTGFCVDCFFLWGFVARCPSLLLPIVPRRLNTLSLTQGGTSSVGVSDSWWSVRSIEMQSHSKVAEGRTQRL